MLEIERITLLPSGAEIYLDQEAGTACIADATGGVLPLNPQEATELRNWLSLALANGSKRLPIVEWKKPGLTVELGDDHAALIVDGKRTSLSFDEQESLLLFLDENVRNRFIERQIASRLEEAVEAEIARRAQENES